VLVVLLHYASKSNDVHCKVQIWDTAGQEKFRPLAKMYYTHSAAAILCYDVTSRNSWEVAKFWLEELHKNVPAGNIVLCLCACKVDSGPVVVSREDSMDLANSNGAMFVETSAKNSNNVLTVFKRVAERVLQFQKTGRETGLGNIPVTPGAAIDSNGNVVKQQPAFTPNTNSSTDLNRYGIVLEERRGDMENLNVKQHERLEEEKKETLNEIIPRNSDFSSYHFSGTPENATRDHSGSTDKIKEALPDPGMCGAIQASSNTNCVIM